MSNPGLSVEQMQEAVDVLDRFHGNRSAAARHLKMDRHTFNNRVDKGHMAGLLPNVKPAKPRIRVPARSVYSPLPNEGGEAVRVLVWGCAHDSPLIPDKSRFRNAGKLASDLRPHYIVDLGDSLDLDSLSTHAVPGSSDDRARPAFLAEVGSLEEAYAEFDATAPSADEIPRYHLKGNHEHRADRFEANNPAAAGVYTTPVAQVFARLGFTEMQYREWLYLEGVGFTHAPITGTGREIGGKFPDQMVAQEATHSIVWSHTHKSVKVNRPKFGIGNAIQVFNTGSFMPTGYLKAYAGLATTGWTYGIHELTLRDGQIESQRTWSERELRERFG